MGDLKRNPFFPEGTQEYWGGTSVTKEDSFIIFGGTLDVYKDLTCPNNYCLMEDEMMLQVHEYRNDSWKNLGTLLAGKYVRYASGVSFQNQLMILGGERFHENNS